MLTGDVFSDESCFQLCPDDNRRRVWRLPGQLADPAFTIVRHTGPQPGVTVWGAITLGSRTPLVIIRGTLTPQRCVDDILRTVLLPFFLQYLDLIFQKIRLDHMRHVCVAMNCLTACQTLPWPSRSPDLSSIEHV
ncbi:transposable element Tc1 transposase [Trichonephila clavipes]|uniref:Transposable element Tc1 transposase n=1 Tax=Trichonephila clavipes TaxID=2585209 RepID=A0A8X6V5J0_TRICX|nr:transposable element Tc1 transposase [Trichonephila clavipes]